MEGREYTFGCRETLIKLHDNIAGTWCVSRCVHVYAGGTLRYRQDTFRDRFLVCAACRNRNLSSDVEICSPYIMNYDRNSTRGCISPRYE